MKIRGLLGIALLALLSTGCGGLHARGSVSPIDFLLPGAGHLLHVRAAPKSSFGSTNALLATRSITTPITISNREYIPGILTYQLIDVSTFGTP